MKSGTVALAKGQHIRGKWTKQHWVIRACLGTGANGTVYAVQRVDGEIGAMKVCKEAGGVAFEWGLLEKMSHTCSAFPAPQCIDDSVDQPALYFYVMEQIQGQPLADVWARLDSVERKRVLLGILYGLRQLHLANHAFCDVKPQNILVHITGEQAVRFVDVGGVTPFGRSVRQFTPGSDLAYWGLGERRANAQYDLVAVALMLICLEQPVPPNVSGWPVEKRKTWLWRAIRNIENPDWQVLLATVVKGGMLSADEFLRRAYQLSTHSAQSRVPGWKQQANSTNQQPTSHVGKAKNTSRKSRSKDWTSGLMWWSLAAACASTALAWAFYLR